MISLKTKICQQKNKTTKEIIFWISSSIKKYQKNRYVDEQHSGTAVPTLTTKCQFFILGSGEWKKWIYCFSKTGNCSFRNYLILFLLRLTIARHQPPPIIEEFFSYSVVFAILGMIRRRLYTEPHFYYSAPRAVMCRAKLYQNREKKPEIRGVDPRKQLFA